MIKPKTPVTILIVRGKSVGAVVMWAVTVIAVILCVRNVNFRAKNAI